MLPESTPPAASGTGEGQPVAGAAYAGLVLTALVGPLFTAAGDVNAVTA